jgi:hypothetical protein
MRTLVFALCAIGASVVSSAADRTAGRWQGVVRIPGSDLQVVIDLDRNASGGWIGSLTSAGLHVKGAPLDRIVTQGSRLQFALRDGLGPTSDNPVTFSGTFRTPDSIEGTFSQGGHTAPFTLTRTGTAQVDLPPANTAVSPALVGTWKGDYEMSGYPRHVTLGLTNHTGGAATAEFVVVGKQEHTLSVDLLTEEEGLLRVESHQFQITIEGRLQDNSNELIGTIAQGPLEAPIVLRRVGQGVS